MFGEGTKILIIIFMIHSFLYIGQTTADIGYSGAGSATWLNTYGRLNITNNETTNETTVSNYGAGMSDLDVENTGIVGGYTSFFNPLAGVWGLLSLFWGIIAAPWTLFTLPIHWVVKLIVIGPLGMMYMLALMQFMRGASL